MAQAAKRTETLVGLFLFVGLALLAGLIVQFGRIAESFRSVYALNVAFRDASGLIKGSQVKLSGAIVGEVAKEPRFTEDGSKVIVELAMHEDAPRIDKNSVIQIKSVSVLGDRAIVITRPEHDKLAGAVWKDGDLIQGGGQSGLDALQDEAIDIAADASDLIVQARTTLGKLDSALDEVRVVAGLLSESVDQVNNGILSEENLENFSAALADLKGATGNIRVASGEIGPVLAEAKSAFRSIGNASDEAQVVFEQASSEIRKIGPALEMVPDAVDSITRVADNASEFLDDVKDERGVVGSLIYDKEPAEDAKVFLKNLRHYGILRYRDAETIDERDPRNRFRGRRR